MREEIEVAVVAKGVGLNSSGRLFVEPGRKGKLAEEQFVGAIEIFDAGPDTVASLEGKCGFKQVAIEDGGVLDGTGAAPQERVGPVPFSNWTVVDDGSGHAALILRGKERFWAGDLGVRVLRAPILRRLDGEARGPRIDGAGIDVPAGLIGLAAVKSAGLDTENSIGSAEGDDVSGDVSGILGVVAERGDGIFGCGNAVGIGGGSDGGIADGSGVEGKEAFLAEMEVVEGGEFHKEIVRMLAVNDGKTESGFALLKQQGIAAAGDGGGFEAEHGARGKGARAEFMLGHAHEPVGGKELIGAAGSGLLRIEDEDIGVKHEFPMTLRGHEHGDGSGVGFGSGAGSGVIENLACEGSGRHVHVVHGLHGAVLILRAERRQPGQQKEQERHTENASYGHGPTDQDGTLRLNVFQHRPWNVEKASKIDGDMQGARDWAAYEEYAGEIGSDEKNEDG